MYCTHNSLLSTRGIQGQGIIFVEQYIISWPSQPIWSSLLYTVYQSINHTGHACFLDRRLSYIHIHNSQSVAPQLLHNIVTALQQESQELFLLPAAAACLLNVAHSSLQMFVSLYYRQRMSWFCNWMTSFELCGRDSFHCSLRGYTACTMRSTVDTTVVFMSTGKGYII